MSYYTCVWAPPATYRVNRSYVPFSDRDCIRYLFHAAKWERPAARPLRCTDWTVARMCYSVWKTGTTVAKRSLQPVRH